MAQLIELQSAVSFGTGVNSPHGLIYVQSKGKVYVSTMSGHAIRFNNPDDLSDKTLYSGSAGNDIIYVASKDKVYVPGLTDLGGDQWGAAVVEIDPTTWTGTIVIQESVNSQYESFASDGTYIYCADTSGKVKKWRLSDYTLIDTIDLFSLYIIKFLHACRIDGTKLYVTNTGGYAGGPSTPSIVRIDLTSFTVEDHQSIEYAAAITDDFCFVGNYIFLGIEKNTPNIIKVQKDSLSNQTHIDTGITDSCYCTYYDGTSVWAGFNQTPGKIVRVNPDTLAVDTFTLSAGNNANEIWSDELGRLYVTFFTSPGAISQIEMYQGWKYSAGFHFTG